MSSIKWAIRILLRNRDLSLIHILSLSVGICGCIFLFTYCHQQLTYDSYHEDLSRMYRINSAWFSSTDEDPIPITPGTLSAELLNNYPFVESAGYVSLINNDPPLSHGDKNFKTKNFFPTNQGLLSVFRFEFIHGTLEKALSRQKSLILNETYAKRIFGEVQCIGRFVEIEGNTYSVTGVFKDWPFNVDFKINGLFFNGKVPTEQDQFGYRTFVKLVHDTYEPELYHALANISNRYYENSEDMDAPIIFRAQALEGLHFKEALPLDTPKGNKYFVYIYLLTGLILYTLVITNQINLNFIRNADMIKKYGIMRILGSDRWHIRCQHLLENCLIFLLASILALTLFQITMHLNISIDTFPLSALGKQPMVIVFILLWYLLTMSVISFLSASLCTHNSLAGSLRKEITKKLPNARFRDYLVMLQYAVCFVLMAVLMVLFHQYRFIKNKNLGFRTDGLYVVEILSQKESASTYHKLTEQFGVENVSSSSWILNGKDVTFSTIGSPDNSIDLNANVIPADPTFFDIMEIDLLKGNFPPHAAMDIFERGHRVPVLINQTLAARIKEPIGMAMDIDNWFQVRIAGIVKDFHLKSLRNPIEPTVIFSEPVDNKLSNDGSSRFIIRTTRAQSSLAAILKREVADGNPFDITSAKDTILSNYTQEQDALRLVSIFTVLCAFVACLGIIGILQYSMKKRRFEIGIRKILGATSAHLFALFGSRIFIMLGLAVIFSFPVILLLKNYFLKLYAYRAVFGPQILLIPTVTVYSITLILIYMLIRSSSTSNPAELIREE